MRRAAVAVAVACSALAAAAAPECAYACTCAQVEPERALAAADAAFVGTLVERRGGIVTSSADPVTLVFTVERVLKGDLPARVEVRTAASGASCGVEGEPGRRLGLYLDRDGGRWTSGLCSQFTPEAAGVEGRRWGWGAAAAAVVALLLVALRARGSRPRGG